MDLYSELINHVRLNGQYGGYLLEFSCNAYFSTCQILLFVLSLCT